VERGSQCIHRRESKNLKKSKLVECWFVLRVEMKGARIRIRKRAQPVAFPFIRQVKMKVKRESTCLPCWVQPKVIGRSSSSVDSSSMPKVLRKSGPNRL